MRCCGQLCQLIPSGTGASKGISYFHVQELTGKDFAFYNFDLCQKEPLRDVFRKHKIETVVHMAGLKAVGESVQLPLKYYQNNLISTTTLLEVLQPHFLGHGRIFRQAIHLLFVCHGLR